MRWSSSVAFLSLVIACGAQDASAAPIPEQCAVPNPIQGRNSFYVDPVKGNIRNDGSAASPWNTLADVLDPKNKLLATRTFPGNYPNNGKVLSDLNPSGPIKPGDVIYARSGDHGNVQINGAVNKEFITVQAEAGQTPTLRSLRVNGAAKWIFSGLKIQGAGDGSTQSLPGTGLVEFGRNQWFGPTTDIEFSQNSISTADDTRAWADIDWVKKPFLVGVATFAKCITISRNHFFNLRNGIGIDGEYTLVSDNKIDNFGNDGINIIASHVTVRRNSITEGRNSKAEALHADGIQGWSKKGATNTNVTIDGNTIIKTGSPDASYMQGIGIFDGRWDKLTITNNVIVTNHWHGITVHGLTNSRIMNNTVVAFDASKRDTWISIVKEKDGPPLTNVVLRNNIAPRIMYPEEGVTADHNIVSLMIAKSIGGKTDHFNKPGTYDRNSIIPGIFGTLVKVDHVNGKYDLRPRPNSPAVGGGNPEFAPSIDITGKRRPTPIDVGAYARTN